VVRVAQLGIALIDVTGNDVARQPASCSRPIDWKRSRRRKIHRLHAPFGDLFDLSGLPDCDCLGLGVRDL